MSISHKERVINLFLGATVSRAIYAACELGIADHLQESAKTAEELSEKIGTDPQSLYRLMRMLAGHEFFEENNDGKFTLTELGKCLTKDHPDSLFDFIRQEDETRWRSLGKLKAAVVHGTPSFDQIYGKNYFEYLAADEQLNARFEAGMSNLTLEEDKTIASLLDPGGAKTLVDVGGGRGGLIAQVLKTHPSLRGTLFELPHVVFPKENLLLGEMEKRCEVVSGSFFESVPKEKDIYLLKRVLHDWDDTACQTILKNICESMSPNGKVIAIEAIVPEGNGFHVIKDVDVYMMALFPGRERTENEFSALFASAGLKLTKIHPTPTGLALIEGIPL